ncbi:hypothetical protein [Dactylosporangium siamense]|uniref:Right handed beta helix domain-containing protein n=3 Tax=Dactylosporangium siamense TaxID=685454 RepID=A0A919UIR2_9ACTN|nr:hypothetical protein [Dactylosporangium siamense]GIG52960.1 hypothetical protein Dsi01nite_110010 [Dactylosporangium siamense]
MNPHSISHDSADVLPAAGSPLHPAPQSAAGRSPLRRAGVGIVAALLATGGLTACKDTLPGYGAVPGYSAQPGASTSTGASPSASTGLGSPSASTTPATSASPSGSTSPAPTTTSTTTQSPSGNPTYTVAGFPAANNTGYPQGLAGDTRKKVTLTPYTGPMTITVAGTVIDSKDINGHIEIKAKNVTIRNSRIRVANVQAVTSTDDNANLRIEDTEIDGQLKDASTGGIALIGRTGFTLLRVNAHGSGDILRIDGRGTVQDSWLHDPGGTGSAQHNDVIQSTNAIYVRILHNRLENQHTQTSCILLKADIGSINDVIVDSNLMNGGGYSFYWYDANYKITNGKVTNNKFMRQSGGGFWPKGGYYGTQALNASTLPTWSNNTWADNGQQIGR